MAIQFIPTEEQSMLRDSIRRWGAGRELREPEDFAPTWSYGAEQGWLMAGVPDEFGGLGGTAFDQAVIAEELGRSLVRAPFVEIGMVAAQLLQAVDPARVADIVMGAARPIFAHDEAAARGDLAWVETRAKLVGSEWQLTGKKTGLIGAAYADCLIVSALVEREGVALFEIDADNARLNCFTTFDGRSGGELLLEGTPARLLTTDAMPAISQAMDRALVMEAAEAVGAMERALELTREYLLTRKQYGQLIGEFQALRHRFADMFIETEQARSIVLRGLELLDGGDPQERSRMAAAVKARVAQAGLFVGGNAIQLHGGIGVTDEYPVGHFYKRLLAFDQRHGGGARQVERFTEMAATV